MLYELFKNEHGCFHQEPFHLSQVNFEGSLLDDEVESITFTNCPRCSICFCRSTHEQSCLLFQHFVVHNRTITKNIPCISYTDFLHSIFIQCCRGDPPPPPPLPHLFLNYEVNLILTAYEV